MLIDLLRWPGNDQVMVRPGVGYGLYGEACGCNQCGCFYFVEPDIYRRAPGRRLFLPVEVGQLPTVLNHAPRVHQYLLRVMEIVEADAEEDYVRTAFAGHDAFRFSRDEADVEQAFVLGLLRKL